MFANLGNRARVRRGGDQATAAARTSETVLLLMGSIFFEDTHQCNKSLNAEAAERRRKQIQKLPAHAKSGARHACSLIWGTGQEFAEGAIRQRPPHGLQKQYC